MELRMVKIEHPVSWVTSAYTLFNGDEVVGEIYHTNESEWSGSLYILGAEPELKNCLSRSCTFRHLQDEYIRLMEDN